MRPARNLSHYVEILLCRSNVVLLCRIFKTWEENGIKASGDFIRCILEGFPCRRGKRTKMFLVKILVKKYLHGENYYVLLCALVCLYRLMIGVRVRD